MPELNTVTDPNLHEPKGASTAGDKQVYVADGLGSGDWTALQYSVAGVIANISTAETVYVPIPYGGSVKKVTTVLEDTIATSDATIDVKNSSGTSMGTITVTQSASASGDVDTLEPASNNTVSDNDYITIETDGASTNAERLWFTVTIDRS